MLNPLLTTCAATLLVLSGPVEPAGHVCLDLEPAFNGAVSASGLFPSQAMEDEFAAYLHWTKDRGISRLVAFESLIDRGSTNEVPFPNPRMAEQFEAYLRWVDDQGLSPFYAFTATNGD